jgi:ubiquinone/menaquinone biosynthesis C-methylase UbiE
MEYGVLKRFQVMSKTATFPNKLVLDVGCGYGGYSLGAAKDGAGIVVAIDIVKRLVQIAKATASELHVNNIDFVVANAELLPFQDGVGDIVFCNEMLEHVMSEQVCISEINRVLKSNGTLLFSVPNRFYLFEMHTVKFFGTAINFLGLGVPFLSLAPIKLRCNLNCPRIYTEKKVYELLQGHGLALFSVYCFMPTFDAIKMPLSQKHAIRKILKKIEKVPVLGKTGAYIVVIAKKV